MLKIRFFQASLAIKEGLHSVYRKNCRSSAEPFYKVMIRSMPSGSVWEDFRKV
jgi:hypothetical protein